MSLVRLVVWHLQLRKIDCGYWRNLAAAAAVRSNQNLAAPTDRLDHEWWIVIELDGSIWCDDDHVFGKSIFWGF